MRRNCNNRRCLCFTIALDDAQCTLTLLKALENANFFVLVIGNGPDNRFSALKFYCDSRDEFAFLSVGYNSGYAHACNLAIGWGKQQGFSDLLHFNSDVVVEDPNIACSLLDTFKDQDRFSIISPTILTEARDIDYAGTASLARVSPVFAASRAKRTPDQTSIQESLYFDGACYIASMQALDRLGGFDEAYFAYREEIDLATRARGLGLKIGYAPAISVMHLGAQATRSFPEFRDFLLARNQVLFGRKRLAFGPRISYFFLLLIKLGIKAGGLLLGLRWARFRMSFKGLLCGAGLGHYDFVIHNERLRFSASTWRNFGSDR